MSRPSWKVLAGASAATMAAFPALYGGYRVLKKQQLFAPGIPADRKIQPPREPMEPTHWRMVVQHHPAARAGDHRDLRLGDPVTGQAHSWATKKEIPGPGDPPIAVYQQPTHDYDYLNFEGELTEGYGRTKAGKKVTAEFDEPAKVLKAGPGYFRFNTDTERGTEKFVLTKKRGGGEERGNTWFLINVTKPRGEKQASAEWHTGAAMNRYFADEMMKIARKGYRKRRGVLLDQDIPILRGLPKDPDAATKALLRGLSDVKKTTWSHAQVAVPVDKMPDPRKMGFSTDPFLAIPLPGEKWFSRTWRRGRLHAHRRGPYYIIHADKNPGFPRSLADVKHIIEDVPPAVWKRLLGAAKPPVILKDPRKR